MLRKCAVDKKKIVYASGSIDLNLELVESNAIYAVALKRYLLW